VLESLETVVLRRLMKEGDPECKALIQSFLDAKIRLSVEALPLEELQGNQNGFDLKEIFDRLNAQYFANKLLIEAWMNANQFFCAIIGTESKRASVLFFLNPCPNPRQPEFC